MSSTAEPPARSSRRACRDPAEVRRLLIQTATEVYRTRPYEEVTNSEIAARAGVSSSVLYRKFPTKALTGSPGQPESASGPIAPQRRVPRGASQRVGWPVMAAIRS